MTFYSASDLLDQLMGPNRNLAPGEKPKSEISWSDKNVCKYFLCGFCPYELFTNTKADLGTCPHVHDEALRKKYEESDRYGKMGFEESFLHFINKILQDCEKKIQRGYERLKNKKPLFQETKDRDAYDAMNDKINLMLKKVEELGSKGMVEEAADAMQNVEDIKCELGLILQRATVNPRFGQDRDMEVCAVCGSLTLVNDLPTRFEDHLNGRQHVGYAKIRTQVQKMTESQYWKVKPKEEKDEKEKKSREHRSRSKSVGKKRRDHSDKKRNRSKSGSKSPNHQRRSDRRDESPKKRRSHHSDRKSREHKSRD